MDIVDRLNYFLENSGISKSQFADNCNIPRPTASQILSGRNKKISDEIIAKVHIMYPQLSIMWLMFGEGNMLTSKEVPFAPHKNSENSLFENNFDTGEKEYLSNVAEANVPPVIPFQKRQTFSASKTISKIVVFYSDNSFEEFHKI